MTTHMIAVGSDGRSVNGTDVATRMFACLCVCAVCVFVCLCLFCGIGYFWIRFYQPFSRDLAIINFPGQKSKLDAKKVVRLPPHLPHLLRWAWFKMLNDVFEFVFLSFSSNA